MAMLEFRHVTISYRNREVVRDFSMSMEEGQIVSLVGESGSGKTTVVRSVLGLLPTGGKVTGGDILLEGRSLLGRSGRDWKKLRGSEVSMIFQDAGAMMNPTKKVGKTFVEYIRTHESCGGEEARQRAISMLERMRLPEAGNIMNSYPFQLSGGMRQRVGIAMAMTFRPRLLLADEPTSALDVTTQAQIIRQMMELREESGTAILMVTHNLGVAAYMSDHILVLRDGIIEDQGSRDYMLTRTENTYVKTLLDAVPTLGGERYV